MDMKDKAVLLKAADGFDPTVKLSEFNVTKQLGDSKYGTVYFAWLDFHEIKAFAIRSISKKNVANADMISAIFLEH